MSDERAGYPERKSSTCKDNPKQVGVVGHEVCRRAGDIGRAEDIRTVS